MRRPFNGTYPITRPFGVYDPAYTNYPNSVHPGTDYGLPSGTPVVAAMSGKVQTYDRADSKVGRGKEIVITNGTTQVKYCHLSRIDIPNGSTVTEGQSLGLSGWTGYVEPKSTVGAHLHFELLINGVYTDFEQYLKEEQVSKPTYKEVLTQFRTFTGSDPTEKQMNYYVEREWGVLNGDLLQFNYDRRRELQAKLGQSSEANILGQALIKLLNSLGWKKG